MKSAHSAGKRDINHKIGRRLHHLRATRGLSMEALGDEIGVTFQQIQKYERGTNIVSPEKLVAFSRIFDVPVAYFFEEPSASEKRTVIDAGFMRLLARLQRISRERPKAIAVIHAIARVICKEIESGCSMPPKDRHKR
jgi:transcriptional regulator with XRE-family HTH domain